jgi:putative oxidoreductase
MEKTTAIGWTLVRAAFGLILALAFGRQKLSGDAMDGFVQAVAALGFPFAAFFAWCSALAEFVGGLMVAAGLFTRYAAAIVSFNMAVAIYSMRAGPPLMALPAVLFLLVMLGAVVAGGGPYSLDAYWRRRLSTRARPQVAVPGE